MTDFFQNYLVILIETTCCMMFFEIFEDDKNRRTGVYSRWMYIVGLSLITNIEVYYLQVFLIRQIIDAVITALVFALYFKEKIRKCLILSVVFSGILWLADFITVIIYPTLIREDSEDTEIVSLLVLILAKLILFLIIVVMNNVFRDNYTEYIREKDWLTFMFLPIFSIATASVFVKKAPAVKGSGLETFFVGLAIGLVCMNVMMFYFIKNIGKREYVLREQGLMELEARNKLQLYETVSDKVQRQRQISHEYKNQIACIQSLVERSEYEELREYLEQIRGEVLHDLDQIDTNHAIVNAVLNAKYQEAVSRSIVVICRVNDLSGLAMDSSDLVILLLILPTPKSGLNALKMWV